MRGLLFMAWRCVFRGVCCLLRVVGSLCCVGCCLLLRDDCLLLFVNVIFVCCVFDVCCVQLLLRLGVGVVLFAVHGSLFALCCLLLVAVVFIIIDG